MKFHRHRSRRSVRRLARVPFLEEYWFDWKTDHSATRIAKRSPLAQNPPPEG